MAVQIRYFPPLSFAALLVAILGGCTDQDRQVGSQIRNLGLLLDESGVVNDTEEDELLVQLVFGSGADLDLYVTDPLLETVYFANNRARSGGEIAEDLKCDAGELRIEEVRFKFPVSGHYRVGIDFPERCEGSDRTAAYIVIATRNGENEEARGSVQLQQFKVVAMEFQINDTEVSK